MTELLVLDLVLVQVLVEFCVQTTASLSPRFHTPFKVGNGNAVLVELLPESLLVVISRVNLRVAVFLPCETNSDTQEKDEKERDEQKERDHDVSPQQQSKAVFAPVIIRSRREAVGG
jgi:hypothetical protein